VREHDIVLQRHGEGWLVKLRFSTDSDLKGLMNAEEYDKYVQSGEG